MKTTKKFTYAAAVELAGLFRRYDFLKVRAQTHATLAGVRAMIRLCELTDEREYLEDAIRVYDLYLKHGMTENYASSSIPPRPIRATFPSACRMTAWRSRFFSTRSETVESREFPVDFFRRIVI